MELDVHLTNRREDAMAAGTLNLAALLKDIPRGAWVAISSDRQRVVSYGADMRDVLKKANDKGEPNPIIMRVPQAAGALLL
jgi:hypothetical protein